MSKLREISAAPLATIILSVMLLCSTFLLFFHILPRSSDGVRLLSQTIMSGDASTTLSNVHSALKKADIIPDVIDDFDPILLLNITWSDKEFAYLGNTLRPKDLSSAPKVLVYSPSSSLDTTHLMTHKNNPNLIIIMTDPDAPSRKDHKWSEFCHWIARNVPKKGHIEDDSRPSSQNRASPWNPRTNSVKELVSYRPPGPPPGTGKHRYVFLALSPTNGTSKPLDLSVPGDRRHWGADQPVHGVREWANDNGLAPIAANFIYAEH